MERLILMVLLVLHALWALCARLLGDTMDAIWYMGCCILFAMALQWA